MKKQNADDGAGIRCILCIFYANKEGVRGKRGACRICCAPAVILNLYFRIIPEFIRELNSICVRKYMLPFASVGDDLFRSMLLMSKRVGFCNA